MNKLLPFLFFYRIDPNAKIPEFATDGSACFDLRCIVNEWETDHIYLHPGESHVFRTGLSAVIPEGHHVEVFARSGMAFKYDIGLANGVGVIDQDYRDEWLVKLTRHDDTMDDSPDPVKITTGDRIAQARLIKTEKYIIGEMYHPPEKVETRNGGFGSTGEK